MGFIESLLSLRASVGLMVLAPSPEMCGAVDCRLLEVEDGVCSRCCAGDLPGERLWFMGIELGSGVREDTVRWPGCCLEGGWNDFAFAVRVAFGSLGAPMVGLRLVESVSLRLPLFKEGARPS